MTDHDPNFERKLRDAMRTRAASVDATADDATLSAIESRTAAAHRARERRHRGLVAGGIAASVLAIAGVVALTNRDSGQKVQIAPVATTPPTSTTSTSTTTSTTTTTTTTTEPPSTTQTTIADAPLDLTGAVWPSAAGTRFTTAAEAALSFATAYLGFGDATVVDATDDVVQIQPFAGGGPITTVFTEQRNGDYVVTGSAADDAVVDTPASGDTLTHPLTVSGQSTAFEATIILQVRPRHSTEAVVQTSAMGGSMGEMGPFTAQIDVPADLTEGVLVVGEPDVSDRGQLLSATVILLG